LTGAQKPFIAWGIGSLCAFAVENPDAGLSTAISAALVAGIVYLAIARVESSTGEGGACGVSDGPDQARGIHR